MGRSVQGTLSGAEMGGQPPALQTQLSSQQEMPHSAGTQHSGPLWTVLRISMVRCWFMVGDVLQTTNTATTPGTLRTPQALNTYKLYSSQLVKITLIEYLR